jgi:RNA polymerase sigma-70 factor, ECF subfamily
MAFRSESELIAASKRGDRAAVAELFEQHYASSLQVARGILRDEEGARDAVQSSYLSAFRNLQVFRGDAAFKTWITRIVRNECLMRLRQAARRNQSVSLDESAGSGTPPLSSPGPTPETSAFRREIASALLDGAAKLPNGLSQVFQLYAFSGLSVSEVASAIGLTVSAAKSRLFRAQLHRREHLKPVWSGHAGRLDRAVRGC